MILTFETVKGLIKLMPWPAHVKDREGNYIYSNKKNDRFFGKPFEDDFVGHDIQYVQAQMPWNDEFVARIRKADKSVLESGKEIKLIDEVVFDVDNFIHVQDMIKLPLVSDAKPHIPNAILTIVHDKTSEQSLMQMYTFYKKNIAKEYRVTLFLKQFKLLDYFSKLPTEKQLICLINITINKNHKYLAEVMCVSVKTIENYITQIKQKLNIELLKLMEMLRK